MSRRRRLDLSVEQIAAHTGAAERTVKSWLYRERAALAAALADPDPSRESDHAR